MNLKREMKTAELAAARAGSLLLKFSGKIDIGTRTKGGGSLVTDADIAAEKVIIDTIKKEFPDHKIISEEMGKSGKDSEYTWIIDPLDGTHNFSFGVPIWGTMIALMRKDEVVLSVINLPTFNALCVAQKGKGSYVNGKKVHVSKRNNLPKSKVYFSGLNRYAEPSIRKIFTNTINVLHKELIVIGSVAVGGVFVASGYMDGIVATHNQPWDTLPIAFAVEEAGGKVTDIKGKKHTIKSENCILSNGLIHDELIRILNS